MERVIKKKVKTTSYFIFVWNGNRTNYFFLFFSRNESKTEYFHVNDIFLMLDLKPNKFS